MHVATRVLASLALLLVACGEDAAVEPVSAPMPPTTADAAVPEDDDDLAQETSPAEAADDGCEDDPATPGNDCVNRVACGPMSCEVCCMKGFAESVVCATDGVCPEDFLDTPCDGPEDCGDGEECCAGAGEPSMCKPTGSCDPMCHTDEDCAPGTSCSPGNTLNFWGFCG